LRVMSSSRKVSRIVSSSPCLYIGDGGPWDEPSSVEADGGEDRVGDEGGVDASLDEDDKTLV
jgi:hypothetical protein